MSSPLVVLVLIAAGDAREVSTQSMTATAEEALDPGSVVLVREGARISDPEAVQLADTLHADAVAIVTWREPDRVSAHLHLYASRRTSWNDRDLSFAGTDATEERGKMLGFAIAAMVPPRVRAPITADVPGRGADDDSRGEPRASSPLPVLPSRGPDPERGAVDIVTIGSSGSGGNAGGFGGVLLTRWRVASTVMFCFGGGGRTGEISELRSSATVILAKAGVSWQPFRTNGERFFALGLRADLLASLQLVSRTLAFDQTSRGSRWMPGADLLVEGGWYFHPRLAAVAAFGGEVAFGTTRVYIGDVQRATIPKLRMVGELGVRVRF